MKKANELPNPYAPPVSAVVAKAYPRYRLVGSSFKLGRSDYSYGYIIFSPNALFLIPKQPSIFTTVMFLGLHGVVSKLTGKSVRQCKSKFKTDLEEFPDDISHPEWPINLQHGLVFRIPKEACVAFNHSWLIGISVKTEDLTIQVVPQFAFFSNGTKHFLDHSGWLGIGSKQNR